MGSLFASPRKRRRAARFGAVVAAGLAVGLSLVYLRNTAPPHKQVFTKGAPQVDVEPRAARHTRRERAAALAVAADFLRTAVERRDVGRSWALTDPSLRVGYTRREWATGDSLPFAPYHFSQVRVRPNYSVTNKIGLEVALFPDRTEKQRAMVFYLDLKKHGAGKRERWLVSYFDPAPSAYSAPTPGAAAVPVAGARFVRSSAPLSATWLLLPLSALSLIVLIPLVLGIRGFVRNRRAMRAYRSGALRPPLL